jgi:CRISPR-associated protein Cmr2
VPKSSLDGARESVIKLARKDRELPRYKTPLRKLGLGMGEELDVLGVAKRVAVDVERFTPYSRIAADAWLASLTDPQRDGIAKAYKPLVKEELATGVTGNGRIYDALPYDAQLVYGFRLDNAEANASTADLQLLHALRSALKGIEEEPVPYAVILKADGDRVGELLSKAGDANWSRSISKDLHGFAKSVRQTVRQHRGHAIYAGGDDVLALLPLESAVACARALAAAFRLAMDNVAEQLGVAQDSRPTLSVGLGIGHLLEPLGRLRARADAAEKDAKGNGLPDPRNALAIRLGVRSGEELAWRCSWGDAGIQAIQDHMQAYRAEACPSRLGYELRGIAQRLAWAMEADCKLPGIHAADLVRTLDRARQRGGEVALSTAFKERLTHRATVVGLEQAANELIIARWLSARTQSDIGTLE